MEEDIELPQVVVDASAMLSFLLPDETAFGKVEAIFANLTRMEMRVFAPTIMPCEFANSLNSGVLRKRFTKKRAKEILDRFLKLGIEFVGIDYQKTLGIAFKNRLSFYDASYLYLARQKKAPLLSLDKRLSTVKLSPLE